MEESVLQTLGERIASLRKQAKLTQEDVCEKASALLNGNKIYRSDLSAFEKRGEKITGADKIDALFRVFGHQLTASEKKTSFA